MMLWSKTRLTRCRKRLTICSSRANAFTIRTPETMSSASIGAEEFYVLDHVLYTHYFTNEGHALHLNYWRDDSYFGHEPSSHGCVGMRLTSAEFFWRFARNGTR